MCLLVTTSPRAASTTNPVPVAAVLLSSTRETGVARSMLTTVFLRARTTSGGQGVEGEEEVEEVAEEEEEEEEPMTASASATAGVEVDEEEGLGPTAAAAAAEEYPVAADAPFDAVVAAEE